MAITDRNHILRALADGQERHGYALMEAVEAATDGKVILAPGTLYRTIGRLLRDGLIVEEAPQSAPDPEDERRRSYRITPRGQALLANPGGPLAPLAPVTPPSQRPPHWQADVLRVLADGQEHHAYGLIRAVRAAHGDAVRCGTLTVYRTLHALWADGLVVAAGVRVDPAVNPRVSRQHFRITPRGQDAHRMLAAREPHRARGAAPWHGALSCGVTWGAATGGLLVLRGAGGAGWVTGAVATVVTTGAGLLRRAQAA